MPAPLQLQLTDYLDPTRWRWVLSDERGRFLADHTVRLDPTSRDYGGFLDLRQYLDYHTPIVPPEQQLADLGRWIGEEVFGGLRTVLWQRRALPALTIQVNVPPVAQELLFRPFELACFADGKPFRAAGIRFVYTLTGAAAGPEAKEPLAQALRILAAFSLPVAANPLNLRRERYGLQQLVRTLNQTQGLAVELRVLQYGATRDHLQAALEDGDGWDIIQLSGHGAQGELLLEDAHGGSATIDADALGDLLDLARARLRLLILDACSSGAGSHAAARAQVGLETLPLRQEGAAGNESKRQLDPTYVMTVAPPAAAEGILAVAALQSAGAPHDQLTVAPFSNSGALLAAPGVAIHSARAGGGYTRLSGTSMASPHVTGVAALWAERQLQQSGQVNIPMLAAQVQGNATRHRLAQPSDPLDVGAGLVGAPPG